MSGFESGGLCFLDSYYLWSWMRLHHPRQMGCITWDFSWTHNYKPITMCPWGTSGSFSWLKMQAAYMVLCKAICVNVSVLLQEWHWLLICFWVQFQLLLIAFKGLHGLGLFNRLPFPNYNYLAHHQVVAPSLWNIIPPQIRLISTLLLFFAKPWRPDFLSGPEGPIQSQLSGLFDSVVTIVVLGVG